MLKHKEMQQSVACRSRNVESVHAPEVRGMAKKMGVHIPNQNSHQ